MKLNIAKFQNAEEDTFKLHMKKSDGTLDYADHHTPEEIEAHEWELKEWESMEVAEGEKKPRKPSLRKPKKPFRLMFSSVHSAAYRKAFMSATFKQSATKEMIKKQAQDSDENNKIDSIDGFLNKGSDLIADVILSEDDKWREIIMQTCVGWENLQDEDGNEIEFSKEVLHYVIYPIEHYYLFAQIKEALGDQLNFMVA